jgi:hypothetical protein
VLHKPGVEVRVAFLDLPDFFETNTVVLMARSIGIELVVLL